MTATQNCPRCGAPISAESSPGGLCAACLMKMGLESRSGAPDLVFTGEHGKTRPAPPSIADLCPHFPELEIVELVGQGGMGAVYRAGQRSLGRDVALKVLTVDTSADPSFAERFEREARTLAALSHPGITAVHDFGRRGPYWFFVMEFVDGANLRQMLRAREVGPREALSIVAQVCDALQYAHDHGVVHRDIKPENVLVTRKGQVKLLDFGLAKLVGERVRDNATQAHSVMGTPHYMAPEQWEKPLTVDHRADIYALGVVFYELLTGELPIGRFAAPSQHEGRRRASRRRRAQDAREGAGSTVSAGERSEARCAERRGDGLGSVAERCARIPRGEFAVGDRWLHRLSRVVPRAGVVVCVLRDVGRCRTRSIREA
jgi:predicted Ser/Thr protein kinase